MMPGRLTDLLLPRRCLLCRAPACANLCAGCDADLPAIRDACRRCAIALELSWAGECDPSSGEQLCGSCISRPPPFDQTVAALNYQFPVTVLVQRFKFNRSLASGEVLSTRLLRALVGRHAPGVNPVELIVPVPLHPARQWKRVFNQAEVMARDIGKALQISVAPGAIRRVRRTLAQTGLPAKIRKKNLKGAFAARPLDVSSVALVDDVMTTGATVSECARVLRRAGVTSVSVWVAARAL